MHALVFGLGTPFADFAFGIGNTHADYIYNPHPFHTSQKIFTLQKNKDMFDNVYGGLDPKDLESKIVASGHFVGDSHYVAVIQDMKGNVIDIDVTTVDEEIF